MMYVRIFIYAMFFNYSSKSNWSMIGWYLVANIDITWSSLVTNYGEQ